MYPRQYCFYYKGFWAAVTLTVPAFEFVACGTSHPIGISPQDKPRTKQMSFQSLTNGGVFVHQRPLATETSPLESSTPGPKRSTRPWPYWNKVHFVSCVIRRTYHVQM